MEVLGAVAAATQLCGMLIKALESTARLREILKHGPAQYKCWDMELTTLQEAISLIKNSTSLHTYSVIQLIEIIASKIEELARICTKYCPPSRARLLTKLLWAPRARSIENRILQNFASLEHDKTTLLLLINLSNGSISVENFRCAIMDLQAKTPDRHAGINGSYDLLVIDPCYPLFTHLFADRANLRVVQQFQKFLRALLQVSYQPRHSYTYQDFSY